MYVHIDPETLKQHPWIAVLIFFVGAAVAFWAANAFWHEYLALRNLPCPAEITADNASLGADCPRRWVTLVSGVWHPDRAVEEKRKAPECWVLGPVENTQIPVAGSIKPVLIVVKCDGKVDRQALSSKPVTGMLVRVNDHLWGGGISKDISTGGASAVYVLVEGAGPARALLYAWIGTAFFLAFGVFLSYFLWLWTVRRDTSIRASHIYRDLR